MARLVSRVAGNINDIVRAGDRLAVGLSGGIDSVVLLDILSRLAGRRRFRLSAIHVNHQLSANASRWAAFCRRLCESKKIPLRTVKVTVRRGDSLEAAARAARYDVFRWLRADYVVLAHHQDDQAETLLLQLLRGAGVKGLAAMPAVSGQRSAVSGQQNPPHASRLTPHVLRPLLDVPRSEIERYARQRKLEWIEDESNADSHFLRNYLRHEVLPLIATRFPAYRTTLARAARNLAEAAQLLDELALADGAEYCKNDALEVAGLRRLPRARAKNLLRWFLASRGAPVPNADRLEEALRQALTAKSDARVRIEVEGSELRRFAGALHVVPKTAAPAAGFTRVWRGESTLALPELGGVLIMARGLGEGVSLARLQGRPVTVRVRRGGERLQPDCRRPRRSLKNLLQEAKIPPWRRERLPLIFCGGELVWAAGLGVDCAFHAVRDEAALRPVWMPWS